MDYDSYYLVMNMGTLGVLLVILLLAYPIYFLLKVTKCNCAKNTRSRWDYGLFWNDSILFLKEAYLELIISVLLQSLKMRESWAIGYFWSIFSNCMTIVCIILSVGILLVLLFLLWPNHDKLENDFYKNRFSQAYSSGPSNHDLDEEVLE